MSATRTKTAMAAAIAAAAMMTTMLTMETIGATTSSSGTQPTTTSTTRIHHRRRHRRRRHDVAALVIHHRRRPSSSSSSLSTPSTTTTTTTTTWPRPTTTVVRFTPSSSMTTTTTTSSMTSYHERRTTTTAAAGSGDGDGRAASADARRGKEGEPASRRKGGGGGVGGEGRGMRRRRNIMPAVSDAGGGRDDAFGDFDYDDYDDGDYYFRGNDDRTSRLNHYYRAGRPGLVRTNDSRHPPPSTFFSRKSIDDVIVSRRARDDDFGEDFRRLCAAANIYRPSRVQSLAWPSLLRGESCVVADQTGSGKTLAYLLPLLARMMRADRDRDHDHDGGGRKKTRRRIRRGGGGRSDGGRPRVVILAPTAELADQIHAVCVYLSEGLKTSSSLSLSSSSSSSSLSSSSSSSSPASWTFRSFVTTAAGSRVTNIRDQIRLLRSMSVDVLISTPGRLATILRTRNSGLDLGDVGALVLDEVDFLMVDKTFGPQLRAVGAAVRQDDGGRGGGGGGGGGGGVVDDDPKDDDDVDVVAGTQFVFVTATLPTDVLDAIRAEVPNVTELRGPGLHRITPAVQQTLVDVSVPSTMNRDQRACFDLKVRELLKALRGRRCDRTLVFCNTVETCRDVENALKRDDRGGKRSRVWAYHNALSPDNRLRNLHAFSSSPSREEDNERGGAYAEGVLVCTDRAARGVDFESNPVDHVVLFDFPKDPAEYVRRVGRTARAGRAGASTVFAYGWQLPIARQIMGLGGGGDKDGKGGGKSKGNAKLEGFTMMKSDDGWDNEMNDKEDEYNVKGGARKRKDTVGTAARNEETNEEDE
ncbi:hypothetical protein ACHAW5_010088 [Stephanodiscus triporus]|uniref:RNA helicase n=1 Tax=Stephanodiscus triporus TaxID=2934178 RepID=A0ABD3NDV8_9STRA